MRSADALSLHIYGMEQDGDLIPIPSKEPPIDPESVIITNRKILK